MGVDESEPNLSNKINRGSFTAVFFCRAWRRWGFNRSIWANFTSISQGIERMEPLKANTYLPEIDGLRTFAVLSVFAYHLDHNILPGGFVGVDVFFVISGFLITKLLLRDFSDAKWSITHFYQRRIARIAPAAFFVIATTLVFGYIVYSQQDFASLGANSLAAAFSFINMKLLFQGSYFKISPDAQPLVHYWSLSVEEQFYVVFPLLLRIALGFRGKTLHILGLFFVLSLIGSIVMTSVNSIAAFYILPTRAWELLAGAILAVARTECLEPSSRVSQVLMTLGLIVISLSFVLIRESNFPGWIALIPVLGTLFVLFSVGRAAGAIPSFMSSAIMVGFGKRSYSLYLWHWPVFSFTDYYLFSFDWQIRTAIKIVVPFVLTEFCYRFFEVPIRTWLNRRRNRIPAFVGFVLCASALAVSGYSIRERYYLSATSANIETGGNSINPTGGNGWVVVIGDSQGAMYGYELAAIARELGLRLNVLSAAAGNELPGEPDTLWPRVQKFLNGRRADVIVLAQAWSEKLGLEGELHFQTAIEELQEKADAVIVILEPPKPPSEASREGIRAGLKSPFFEQPDATEKRVRANAIIRKYEGTRVKVLDVQDLFLQPDMSIRLIAPNGTMAFQDQTHLSGPGTGLVRARLTEMFRSVLNSPNLGHR